MTDLSRLLEASPRAAQAAAAALAIEVLEGTPGDVNDLAALADPRHAFLRAAWFRAGAPDGLRTILAGGRDGLPVAAVPLVVRLPGVKMVPGSYWPLRSFPIAAGAREAELRALLADPAARRAFGPVWRLGPVRGDDPSASRLIPLAGEAGWTVLTRCLGTTYMLDLAALRAAGPWPRGSTLRKNRYFEKNLAAEGGLDFSLFSGAQWGGALLDMLADVERGSWIASDTNGQDAKFLAPAHRRFWEQAAADPELAARLEASLLFVGGEPAAFAFYLEAGAQRYLIANTYAEKFKAHSPGRVLLYRDFQRLADAGVRAIDWGAGDPGYKSAMGAQPGPQIVDHLFVRSASLALLLRPFWRA